MYSSSSSLKSSGMFSTSRYRAILKKVGCENVPKIGSSFVHLLEAWLELAGHVAEVLGLLHHLADQLLLALQVVVVKLLVHLRKLVISSISTSIRPLGALKSTGSRSSRSFPPARTCAENTALFWSRIITRFGFETIWQEVTWRRFPTSLDPLPLPLL